MKFHLSYLAAALTACALGACTPPEKSEPKVPAYVAVSPDQPAYFQLTDGRPYIPIGINMINPSGKYRNNPDSALYEIGEWMRKLSENGGNYVRVWLSQSFWDIEDQQAGVYSEEKAMRIDRFVEMARRNGLRIKMTLEHFRSLTLEENPQQWATKFVYHSSHGGPLDSIGQYLTDPAGHKLFLDKADYYRQRYGSDTLFFGWELWNEMNAVRGPEDSIFFAWNERMLAEVKQRFPQNLVMQSLGSFDDERVRPTYRQMMHLPGNEVAQVHRYLDLGAPMEICQQPMDIICASAIEELVAYETGKPIILAETGAVEPRHTGPSKYYPLDTAGILLHDILFAPFFSGSAGAGMSWHWESYVDKNDLWYHFGRFSEAVKGLNPVSEAFVPFRAETPELRIYGLRGVNTTLLWLRDKESSWITELERGIPAAALEHLLLDLSALGIPERTAPARLYDPWQNRWSETEAGPDGLALPAFRRSMVVRIGHPQS